MSANGILHKVKNNSYYLLKVYYVSRTMLNALLALGHSKPLGASIFIFLLQTRNCGSMLPMITGPGNG